MLLSPHRTVVCCVRGGVCCVLVFVVVGQLCVALVLVGQLCVVFVVAGSCMWVFTYKPPPPPLSAVLPATFLLVEEVVWALVHLVFR